MLNRGDTSAEALLSYDRKELDPCVIKAVAGTGHVLDDHVLFQVSRICLALKLTALI